jgi:hypothetical protein
MMSEGGSMSPKGTRIISLVLWVVGLILIPIVLTRSSRLLVTISVQPNAPTANLIITSTEFLKEFDGPQVVFFAMPTRQMPPSTNKIRMEVKPDVEPEPTWYQQLDPQRTSNGYLMFTVQLGNAKFPVSSTMGYDYRILEALDPEDPLQLSAGRIEVGVHSLPDVETRWMVGVSLVAAIFQLAGIPGFLDLFGRLR